MFYPTTCVRLRYGPDTDMLSGFSRELDYQHCRLVPGDAAYCRVSASAADLPAAGIPSRFNALFRQCAGVSLLRLSFAAAAGNGMFTVSSIAFASRLVLRSRLTLIRLAWIRKPWSCGEGVFHPLYRYLYLHLLFRRLHRHSSACFGAAAMLPYQSRLKRNSTSSAPDLCPIIIHARPLDR